MKLIRFAGVTLPDSVAEDDQNTDPLEESLVQVLGGAFDRFGDDEGFGGPLTLVRRALVHSSTASVLADSLDQLRALNGQRGQLVADVAGEERWRYARLQQISGTRRNVEPGRLLVEMAFRCEPGGWRGDAVSQNETMASSPHTLTLTNSGNRTVRDAVLTITAGSAAITSLNIAVSGATDIDFGGTISAGNSLVLDFGAKSVKNNGSDAYSDFSLGSNHAIDGWLDLEPGDTDVVLTFSGGSTDSMALAEYDDGWK